MIVSALHDIQLSSLAHTPVMSHLWQPLPHFCWRLYGKIRKWHAVL